MSKTLRNRLLLMAFANPMLSPCLAANLPLSAQLQLLKMENVRSPSFQKLPAFSCTIPSPALGTWSKSIQSSRLSNLTPVLNGGYRLLPSLKAEHGIWYTSLGLRKSLKPQSWYGLGCWFGFESRSEKLQDGLSWNWGPELQLSRFLICSNLALNPYNLNRCEIGGFILAPKRHYLFFDKLGLTFIYRHFPENQCKSSNNPQTLIKAVCFSLKSQKLFGLFLDCNLQFLDLLKHNSKLSFKLQFSLNWELQNNSPQNKDLFSPFNPRFEPELYACNLVEQHVPSQRLICACEEGDLTELVHQLETGAINFSEEVNPDYLTSKSPTELKLLQLLAQKAVQEGLVESEKLQITIPDASNEAFLRFLSELEGLEHNEKAKVKLSESQLVDFVKASCETLGSLLSPKLDELTKERQPFSLAECLAKPLFFLMQKVDNTPKIFRDYLTDPQILPPQLEEVTEKLFLFIEGFSVRHASEIQENKGEEILALQIQDLLNSPLCEKNLIIDHFNYQSKLWLCHELEGNQRSEIIFDNLKAWAQTNLPTFLLTHPQLKPLFLKIETMESDLPPEQKREKLCQGIDCICGVLKNSNFSSKKLIQEFVFATGKQYASEMAQKLWKETKNASQKVGDKSRWLLHHCKNALPKLDSNSIKSLEENGVKLLGQSVKKIAHQAGLMRNSIRKWFVNFHLPAACQRLRLDTPQITSEPSELQLQSKRKASESSQSTTDPLEAPTRPGTAISENHQYQNAEVFAIDNWAIFENHPLPLDEEIKTQSRISAWLDSLSSWAPTSTPRWTLYGLTAVGVTTLAYRSLPLG